MAKGIIEVEMAENCHECVFHNTYFNDYNYGEECRLLGKEVYTSVGRPDWCPLKEVKE